MFFQSKYTPQYDELKVPHIDELKNIPDYDLLSPCEFYRVLDTECRTFAHEATTVWATGERAKCDQWEKAYENCQKWRETKDREALEKVLDLERSLFKMRQVDIFLNNVWQLRDSESGKKEPPHFNAPLPPFLRKSDDPASNVLEVSIQKEAAIGQNKEQTGDSGKKKVEENCSIM